MGFAGIANCKLEMLFIHPDYFGKGFGHKLCSYAIDKFNVNAVDVNEQNPQALSFYKRQGFSIYSRSSHDDAGRNFPILHLVKRE